MLRLATPQLAVEIAEHGAELRSVRDSSGAEWLWQGDPAWWSNRAPLLFPVIGRSPADHVTIAGASYPMGSHGFARHSDFAVEDADATSARLVLADSAATRAAFPFAFRLELAYRLEARTLGIVATVANRDNYEMPFQFGFHPGFAWPLPRSAGETHRVTLANGGAPPLYRLDADKLLVPAPLPSPFSAGELVPEAQMFVDDAMLFPEGAGERMSFAAAGGARVELRCANLPNFAIWQKPGAPYLCLEPWHGTAPLAGSGDALASRHGRALLAPGASMRFELALSVIPAADSDA